MFDSLAHETGVTTDTHLEAIWFRIDRYLYPGDPFSDQKHEMCCKMQKLWKIKTCQQMVCILERNKYLVDFPGSDDGKKLPHEETNEILFNSTPYGWCKQTLLLRFDFESNST